MTIPDFDALFGRHSRAVYNHAFRLTGSWTVAEDVTQAVFLTAWRRRAEIRLVNGSPLPWLLVTATHHARTEQRALTRWRTRLLRSPTPTTPEPDPADEIAARLDDEHRMREILTAVRSLPRAEREAVALCLWSGLSYPEAATALGVKETTVRSRVSRARSRLSRLLAPPPSGPTSPTGPSTPSVAPSSAPTAAAGTSATGASPAAASVAGTSTTGVSPAAASVAGTSTTPISAAGSTSLRASAGTSATRATTGTSATRATTGTSPTSRASTTGTSPDSPAPPPGSAPEVRLATPLGSMPSTQPASAPRPVPPNQAARIHTGRPALEEKS